MVRKFWQYLKGWRGIALISYVWLILMAYVIVYLDFSSVTIKKKFYFVSVAEIILIALIYTCPKVLSWVEGLKLKPEAENLTHTQKRNFFLKSWLATFGVLLAMYVVFYPGAFSPDSINQYLQASGAHKYNDWHPVLHTLWAFTLPLKLSGGWIGSIILFQIITTSFAAAYMFMTLAEYGNRKYAILFAIYTLANPATLGIIMYPWKDVSFAVFAMLSMTCAVRIYFSGGSWLNSWCNMSLLVSFLSLATIFRHNAILLTFPLLLVVLYYSGKTQKAILIAGCCVVVFMIKGVLYQHLEAEKPNYRIVETTCAPMTIIADAVHEASEKLDNDIVDFLYSVAPAEKWRDHYRTGTFNSVKFIGINRDVIEDAGYMKIFDMTLRCLMKAPYASIRGFAALTDMVYGIGGSADWLVYPGIISNDCGINSGGIRPLQSLFWMYAQLSRIFLKHIFWHTGVLLLIIIMFVLAKFSIRKLCFALPVLAYDFGTMLFLGGNDFRFFWCTYLVLPLVLILLLREAKS